MHRSPVRALAIRYVMMSQEISRTPGFKAQDRSEVSLRLSAAGTGYIPGNSATPIPFNPPSLFESGEISIDGVFMMCMRGVLGRRDSTA